jgi:PAS domain S-box-containing protein
MARKGATQPADKPEMVRWLFENSGDLMHVAAPGGILKLVNPAWERVLGWPEDELIGRFIGELIHPEDLPAVRGRVMDMGPGDVRESQVRLRRKDGEYLWLASRSQKMPDGSLIVTMRDATAERARRRSRTPAGPARCWAPPPASASGPSSPRPTPSPGPTSCWR